MKTLTIKEFNEDKGRSPNKVQKALVYAAKLKKPVSMIDLANKFDCSVSSLNDIARNYKMNIDVKTKTIKNERWILVRSKKGGIKEVEQNE